MYDPACSDPGEKCARRPLRLVMRRARMKNRFDIQDELRRRGSSLLTSEGDSRAEIKLSPSLYCSSKRRTRQQVYSESCDVKDLKDQITAMINHETVSPPLRLSDQMRVFFNVIIITSNITVLIVKSGKLTYFRDDVG
ncbi:hypothetical protein F2P81_026284 [Scophthalmus maximus]|uniref:Uncharacterized protein n=1 Tax=Scophthalmus maximus TaxID=52904 RepID=A0A6A4RHX8_SCOMX|nr:hypothetical protein F2P81_026284 [Scophthalmus maximus]